MTDVKASVVRIEDHLEDYPAKPTVTKFMILPTCSIKLEQRNMGIWPLQPVILKIH